MVSGLVLLLAGAAVMKKGEVDQCRLSRGGTGHGEEEVAALDDGL